MVQTITRLYSTQHGPRWTSIIDGIPAESPPIETTEVDTHCLPIDLLTQVKFRGQNKGHVVLGVNRPDVGVSREWPGPNKNRGQRVEMKGVEPSTSALRTLRSPN